MGAPQCKALPPWLCAIPLPLRRVSGVVVACHNILVGSANHLASMSAAFDADAFVSACSKGQVFQVRALLADAACLDGVSGTYLSHAFREACAHGHLDIVQDMLAMDTTKLNVHNNFEDPFREACRGGHVEVMRELLALEGSRRIVVSIMNFSAFRAACEGGHVPAVRELLQLEESRRVDVHSGDDAGFKSACEHGHVGVVSELLALSGDRRIDLDTVESGFQLACQFGHAGLAIQLLKRFRDQHASYRRIAQDGLKLSVTRPAVMCAILEANPAEALLDAATACLWMNGLNRKLLKFRSLSQTLHTMPSNQRQQLESFLVGMLRAHVASGKPWNAAAQASVLGRCVAMLPALSPVRHFLAAADPKRAGRVAQTAVWQGDRVPVDSDDTKRQAASCIYMSRAGRRAMVLHRAAARLFQA